MTFLSAARRFVLADRAAQKETQKMELDRRAALPYQLDMSGGSDRIVSVADGRTVFELAHGDGWTVEMLCRLNGVALDELGARRDRGRGGASRMPNEGG